MSLSRLNRAPKILFLDFDGVFTDNFVYVDDEGRESMRFSKYDSMGLSILRGHGLGIHIISSDLRHGLIKQRCDKMHVTYSYGIKDKLVEAQRLCNLGSTRLEECGFIGNDVNDISLLDAVGFPIVVRDSHPSLLRRDYLTTRCCGGNGAIREVADRIISVLSKSHEGEDI